MRSQLAAVLSIAATPAWAQPITQAPGYCGPMWGSGWGWMMMGPLSLIVVVGAVIIIVLFGARWFSQGAPPSSSALDILNARYARGEIDKAEYEQKKRDIG